MNKPKDTETKTLAGDGRRNPSEIAFKAFDLLTALVVTNREAEGEEAKKSSPDPDEILATPTPFPIQQLRASLNSARFLALVRDRKDNVRWVNSAFAREFGIDPGKPLDEQVNARIGGAANRGEGGAKVTALNRPVFNIIERIADKGFFRKDKIPIHDECNEAVGVLEILVPMMDRMQDPAAIEERYKRILRKLDKLNTAIRVQKARRRHDQPKVSKDLERLQQLVLPYIDRLKQRRLNREQRRFLDLIEKTLETQPPSPPASNYQLSPTETEVARHVKEGRTNLEIAALMGVSKSTVLTHRHHVRDKLGLKHRKINLRTFLKEQTLAQAPE